MYFVLRILLGFDFGMGVDAQNGTNVHCSNNALETTVIHTLTPGLINDDLTRLLVYQDEGPLRRDDLRLPI